MFDLVPLSAFRAFYSKITQPSLQCLLLGQSPPLGADVLYVWPLSHDVEVDDGLAAAKVGLGAVIVLGGIYAARKLLRK